MSRKEHLYAIHPETDALSDPSHRNPADSAGWRNRQKRGHKSSGASCSPWSTECAATGLVLSCPSKNGREFGGQMRSYDDAHRLSAGTTASFSKAACRSPDSDTGSLMVQEA